LKNQQQKVSLEALTEVLGKIHGGITLSQILNIDSLCLAVQKHPDMVKDLLVHLPSGTENNVEGVCKQIRSAQFKECLRQLSHALLHGELGSFMLSIGLDPMLGLLGDAQKFLIELEKQEEKTKSEDKMKDK